MNRRTVLSGGLALSTSFLTFGMLTGCDPKEKSESPTAPASSALVRAHSPVIGPQDAPVTIVEFLDPSCEGCRAFYPIVKQIMAQYPEDVRLVIRYLPFHKGSEAAIGILEAARMQGVYEPVLQAVFAALPQWHNDSELKAAWSAAEAAGLDVEKAREQIRSPTITQNLELDVADGQAYKVSQTPTFFVNGKPVEPFGPKQLNDLVSREVAASRASH